ARRDDPAGPGGSRRGHEADDHRARSGEVRAVTAARPANRAGLRRDGGGRFPPAQRSGEGGQLIAAGGSPRASARGYKQRGRLKLLVKNARKKKPTRARSASNGAGEG